MPPNLKTNLTPAKIDKLRIQGVRSFSHRNGEVIEFATPLTLIVGYNGSGKTTIIECLKYATTGELPPNSKGGAFIHDPNLAGEKEVMGQVKLAFKGTNQSKMVVTRSMQLTVKKAARTFKTLDGNLVTYKGGERSSLSTRVAGLDKLMPHHLGVSKPVLDLVIFCHQDESLWPMSEPAQLKKKFDEIFEALKYTRALDNIKVVRKKTGDELKVLKQKEASTKQIKALGDKAETDSRALSADVMKLKVEIRELEVKAKEARGEWKAANDKLVNYRGNVESLERKKEDEQQRLEWVQSHGKGLVERKESDEWLQSEVDQFERRVMVYQEQRDEYVKKHKEISRALEQARENLRRRENEAGRYEEQKLNHERCLQERSDLVKESSRRHNIRGYDGDLDSTQFNDYLAKLKLSLKDQHTAVEKVRLDTEREMQKAQKILSEMGETRSALNEGRNSVRQQIATNESRITACQVDLNKVKTDEGAKAALENKIDDLGTRLTRVLGDHQDALWDKKIQDCNAHLSGLDDESKQLNKALVQASRQAGDLANLDLRKQNLKESHKSLEKMRTVHNEKLKSLVDPRWNPSNLESAYQQMLQRKSDEIKEAEEVRDREMRSLEQVEFKLDNVRADLARSKTDLEACTKTIQESVESEPEDYEATMADLQEGRDTRKADVDGFGHQRDFYEKASRKARKDNHCNMCLREFHGGQEREAFLKRVENIISKQSLKAVQDDLKDLEELLRKGKEAGPSHDMWVRLSKTEVPRLQSEGRELEKKREQLIDAIENLQRNVDDCKEAKSELDSLAKPVAGVVKYSEEVATLTAQVQELSDKHKDLAHSRTADDLQEQLEQVNNKAQAKRKEIEKLAEDKGRSQSMISSLELDLSKAKNDLSVANHQLETKNGIFRQIEELRRSNQSHREHILELDEQLREIAPQIIEEESKRSNLRQRGLARENSVQKEANGLSASVDKIKLVEQNIQRYVENGGAARLAKSRRDISSSQQEIQQMLEEEKQVIVKVNKLTEELRDQEDTKRNIERNITYRADIKALEALRNDIAQLTEQIAEEDHEYLTKQSDRWSAKFNAFSTEMTSKLGAARAKDDALNKNIADWKTEFKTAAQDYKKAHIEVEATKAAVEDLGRYGGALDKAIIKYHSIKMEEVNRIIDELWKKTYQGTDVDTILIRSDDENAKGNRSYNYRVCMIKQDAEMDMRGRCSAGQKVLASIIIRLALAECFGVNCGLIALDEPTTNLDRDNIRSLAGSLHDIIQARRHQANFQLIVITHDEEFLKFMRCPDFTDTYYRISRNDEQKSIIERQSIAEVM